MANLNPKTGHLGNTQFKKGFSGNPGGKPKSVSERDWLIARRHTKEAIDKILEFMRGRITVEGEPEKVRVGPSLQLAAAVMILERGWGKPPQALHVADERDDNIPECSETEALEFIRTQIENIATRIDQEQPAQLIEQRAG